MNDIVVTNNTTDQLIDLIRARAAAGLKKYGTTLDRTDLTHRDWMRHMVEELIDGAGYALRAIDTATPDDAMRLLRAAPRPAVRFERSTDGIVIDHETGLEWSAATIGDRMNWAEAEKAAAAVRLGGHDDWRLPTRHELLSIVDDTRHEPAIDTSVFECASAWYWTATPWAPSPAGGAWIVDFGGGDSGGNARYLHARVRAVRSASPAGQ
jgi:hypothetical protein